MKDNELRVPCDEGGLTGGIGMRSHLVALSVMLALAACGKQASAPASANTAAAAPSAAANAAPPAGEPAQVAEAGVSNPAAPAAPGPSSIEIHFQRGANCWKYIGAASTFTGKFGAGQRVDITSTGEQANGDGSKTWYETRPRSVYIA